MNIKIDKSVWEKISGVIEAAHIAHISNDVSIASDTNTPVEDLVAMAMNPNTSPEVLMAISKNPSTPPEIMEEIRMRNIQKISRGRI